MKTTFSEARTFHIPIDRRRFLRSLAIASAGYSLSGYLAEALTVSPTMTQGPYYPLADDIPLDKDNDLVQLTDKLTSAAGEIIYISGRVLDASGNPIRNALVELWHADHEGDYSYSAGVGRHAACDANFAGFGQFITGASGAFKFRTIKAGLYVGRARHLHWGVTIPGRNSRAATQTGWNEVAFNLTGQPWATQNSNDGVFAALTAEQRATILLDFTEVQGATTGERQANWDFVSGFTPVEPAYPGGGGLLVAGAPVAGVGSGGNPRYRLIVPGYMGYTYEIYGNPTLADLGWNALPFAISESGSIDRHKHTATAEGSLSFYVEQKALKGFYKITFRVPGANTGTP